MQRDIEEYLDQYDWYYERRKNYYRNIGKPAARFVTPLYLASAYVSVYMKNPAAGSGLRARFMRDDEAYDMVFSDRVPLDAWVAVTEVFKKTEELMEKIRPPQGNVERFLNRWRSVVAFIAVSKACGRFSYSIKDLIEFDIKLITLQLVREVWDLIAGELGLPLNFSKISSPRNAAFVMACCKKAEENFGIGGIETVGRQKLPAFMGKRKRHMALEESFLDAVNAALPVQPWKPGVNKEVAQKLGTSNKRVYAAMQLLISQGKRYSQKDGVVYAVDGKIIAVDKDRQPPASAK